MADALFPPPQPTRRTVLAGLTGAAVAATLPGRVACAQSAAPTSQPTTWPADDLRWRDARDLTIEGRGWVDQPRVGFFDRLPAKVKGVVREPVWNLSRHSAGISVRFVSDAPSLHVRYELLNANLAMPHMAATGVSGLDLYAKDAAGAWRWMDVVKPTQQRVAAELAKGAAPPVGESREYLLYLPLYNGVTSLEVGVARGAALEPAPTTGPAARKPIVYYGTSIAQGGCASRPGMAHVSIIARQLGREILNLGFSGNGQLDLELAPMLAELDAAAFVLDTLPNCSKQQVEERLAKFVDTLRAARPGVPIVLVEDPDWCHAAWQPGMQRTQRDRRDSYRRIAADLAKTHGPVTHVPIEDAFGPTYEGTVDGVHPSDLGMTQLAARIGPAVAKVIG
jgi:lysophospholipase L1-like esterase